MAKQIYTRKVLNMKKRISDTSFIVLCCLVYFTSYMTRTNYQAAMAKIISAEHILETIASIAVTGSFITYGLGQILSGFIGDKIPPRHLITLGLATTSVCNITVGLTSNMSIIIPIWCINGLAQAMLWPPLVKSMTQAFSPKIFKKACVLVNAASSLATIVVYLVVPLCCTVFDNWHMAFIICACLGILVCVLWTIFAQRAPIYNADADKIENKSDDTSAETGSIWKIIVTTGLIPVMIVIILQGMLRDGIQTWMPKYILDTFNLPAENSILRTAILPIFAILSVYFTQWFRKKNKTEVHTTQWLWVACFTACLCLLIFYKNQMMISILMMAIMTACMHGTNLMLISNLPARFIKYGRVSFFSGALNACTYVGSAIATYGIALLCTRYGWFVTICIWAAIALAGIILSAVAIKKTKKLCE